MYQQYISVSESVVIELMHPIGTKIHVWDKREIVEFYLPYDGESVFFFLYKGYQVSSIKEKKHPLRQRK